jgi:hypothetical protein
MTCMTNTTTTQPYVRRPNHPTHRFFAAFDPEEGARCDQCDCRESSTLWGPIPCGTGEAALAAVSSDRYEASAILAAAIWDTPDTAEDIAASIGVPSPTGHGF